MKIRALIAELKAIERRSGDVDVETPCGKITRLDQYNGNGTCADAHPENGPVAGVLLQ